MATRTPNACPQSAPAHDGPPASGKVRILRPRAVDVVDFAHPMASDNDTDDVEHALLKAIGELRAKRGLVE